MCYETVNASRQPSVLCDSLKGPDVISILKRPIVYSIVFFKCFIIYHFGEWNQNCTLSLV